MSGKRGTSRRAAPTAAQDKRISNYLFLCNRQSIQFFFRLFLQFFYFTSEDGEFLFQPRKQQVMAGIGAPKGNKFHESHGIVTWRNGVKRRIRKHRNVIDQRCIAGKNAVAMRDELIKERGGPDNLSVAELTIIELIARDIFFADEVDRRIFAALAKLRTTEKKLATLGKIKNTKMIGILYSYRQSITRNLAANLLALGLEKPPPKVKSLDEILSEPEDEP
jgi:hypothetical protein